MLPNPNPQRAKRPRYRPISPADTVTTTGNLVNPVGSITPVYTDYSSASYGNQGVFGSSLPTVNTGVPQGVSLPGYYGTSGTPVAQQYNNALGFYQSGNPYSRYQYRPPQPVIGGPGPHGPGAATLQNIQQQQARQQYSRGTNTNTPPALPTGSFNQQQVLQSVSDRLASGANDPINQADADALGLTEALNDPNSGWTRNEQGQYVNTAAPTQTQNNQVAADRRAANTAAGLMYNRFYGWIPRAQWQALRKRRGQMRGQTTEAAQTNDGFVSSFGVVSFNTDAG